MRPDRLKMHQKAFGGSPNPGSAAATHGLSACVDNKMPFLAKLADKYHTQLLFSENTNKNRNVDVYDDLLIHAVKPLEE